VKENVILSKSKAFALKIIKMYQCLCHDKKEFTLSRQILRSGTSIGANVREAIYAQSRADFYAKLHISLKEASQTEYWLELLHESGYVDDGLFDSIYADCKELLRILISITKNQKRKSTQ
jgi:four helix bundle protein